MSWNLTASAPRLPSREAAYRSAEGWSEAQRAKRLILPLFLLLFLLLHFFFRVFRLKIACQVPKPPNPLKQKEIELARYPTQTAILNSEEKGKPRRHPPGLTYLDRILYL